MTAASPVFSAIVPTSHRSPALGLRGVAAQLAARGRPASTSKRPRRRWRSGQPDESEPGPVGYDRTRHAPEWRGNPHE